MKKLLFVLLVLSVFTVNAQVPSYVPTNGLVAYYPFNGNANDASGNGNNGTVNGATLTTDRFGNVGKAYSFDGALATKILVTLNQPIASKANKTFSFWVKYPTNYINPYSHIVTCNNTVPTFGDSYMSTNGNDPSYITANTVGKFYEGKAGLMSNSRLNNNVWHHIVLINDFTNLKSILYIDGILDTSKSSNNYLVDTTVSKIAFGNLIVSPTLNTNSATLLGSLDDIAIYNRALTQSEITGLYNSGTNTCLPSYLPTTGLVGYWPFCGNANDASGNGNNGTVNGATLTSDRFGNSNSAYSFNNSYIVCNNNGPLGSNSKSVSFWAKSNDTSLNANYILSYGSDLAGSQIGVRLNRGCKGLSLDCNFTTLTKSFNNTFNGIWNHYIIIFDSTANSSRFYVNGQLQNQTCDFTSANQLLNTLSGYPLVFGRYCNLNSTNSLFFKGFIDDISIYNRALTQSEITQLYNSNSCIANITNNDTTICRGSSITLNAAAVNAASVTDINGNVYPTVNIGSQTWMQKNLNVSKYKNGDIIPQVTNATQWAGLTTGAWCWYNNDSATYAATYGKLYNWYAVNDPRGLAPEGWHVPSDAEWNKMVKFLDVTADTTQVGWQGSTIGGSLKETGTSHWLNPNTGATNNSGFTALPGGARLNDGNFTYFGDHIFLWSASEYNFTNAWSRYLKFESTAINWNSNYTKIFGFSVRLVNNYSYLWSTGATTPSITVSPTVTTKYYCTVSDGINTCKDSVTVTVSTITTNLITADTIKVCGTSTTISATTGLSSYAWSNGANTASTTVTSSGWYKCTATNGACTAVDSVYVSLFNPKITQNDTTVCAGTSLTLSIAGVNSGSVTDINGNVYPTVNIGSQTWMQKNLNVSKYKNGDIIPQVTGIAQWAALTTGAWCWYNNDSATYAATYGKLYNWYAVNDPRGLAPEGWHVPLYSEWESLFAFLGGTGIAGGKMKETGTSHWLSPNAGATNSSSFTGLPAGYRTNQGDFSNINSDGWWVGKLNNQPSFHNLYYTLESVNPTVLFGYYNLFTNSTGISVRCLKDNFVANPQNYSYLWSTGATSQSITVTPTATTSYIATVSNGINTCKDTVKITVANITSLAPTTIFGAVDVCSAIGTDTASVPVNYKINKVANAASYVWTVPTGATLLSGQGDTSIMVRFSSSFVSGAITVKSVSTCNISSALKSVTVYKRVAAAPTAIQKEFTPTSIVATTNVTGLVSEVYRIKKVLYATSYNWYLNRGTNATITHINAAGENDTAVIVTFASCFVKDTLSVKSVTPCSISTAKTVIMSSNTTPATVAGIGTAGGDFAVCIGSSKTFTAIASTPTTTQVSIASYRWTKPVNTTITSSTLDSSSITVSFNTGFTGGSLTAKGVSSCGVVGTVATSAILQYLPPTPLSIGSSTNSYDACINSSVTYTAIVGAPTTTQAPAALFRWTRPNNTTITAASADSSSITVRFNTGYIGGLISVKGQSRCGTQGAARSQALTHTGCALGTKTSQPITTTNSNSFEVSLYPNPTANAFKLFIKNSKASGLSSSQAIVKVIDIQGRMIKSFQANTNQVIAIGNELKSGVYLVEVRVGEEVKTIRAVKF